MPRPSNSSVPKINTRKNVWNEWRKVPSLSLCFPSNYQGCLMICLFVCGGDSETHHRNAPHSLVCLPGAGAGILGPCPPWGTARALKALSTNLITTPLPCPLSFALQEVEGLLLRRVLNFAGGQGYEKGSPCPGGRHHPSRTGTITGGAFCRALQSGFGTTREIRSRSWYRNVWPRADE